MHRIRAFIARYEHQLSIGSFLVGFAIDAIVLKRIDLLVSNLFLYTYLTLAVLSIALLHRAATKAFSGSMERLSVWLPFVAQFAFGGMFSGFLIFYSQSGSLVASWPFLTLIVVLIISNEFMRTYHNRLTFQSLLLFFCLFSFSIYTLPIVVGRMGDLVFEASGLIALVLFIVFLTLLSFIGYKRVRYSLYNITVGALGIYGLITVLYFSNYLPPIPLALKDIGVYQSVTRVGDAYRVHEQSYPWYASITGRVVTVPKGGVLYTYSSVFAPTRLETSIAHQWQYFSTDGSWQTKSTIPFTIGGGRDGGYRGYTAKGAITPGTWRVNVITERGQLIGRITFTVQEGSAPAMVERTLE